MQIYANFVIQWSLILRNERTVKWYGRYSLYLSTIYSREFSKLYVTLLTHQDAKIQPRRVPSSLNRASAHCGDCVAAGPRTGLALLVQRLECALEARRPRRRGTRRRLHDSGIKFSPVRFAWNSIPMLSNNLISETNRRETYFSH